MDNNWISWCEIDNLDPFIRSEFKVGRAVRTYEPRCVSAKAQRLYTAHGFETVSDIVCGLVGSSLFVEVFKGLLR